MGLLKRISNGTTTYSDSNLVVSISFAIFVLGIIVGIIIGLI